MARILTEMTELEKVESWRLYKLIGAGYPVLIAERLAAAVHVDLHLAVDLVLKRGCSCETAERILR